MRHYKTASGKEAYARLYHWLSENHDKPVACFNSKGHIEDVRMYTEQDGSVWVDYIDYTSYLDVGGQYGLDSFMERACEDKLEFIEPIWDPERIDATNLKMDGWEMDGFSYRLHKGDSLVVHNNDNTWVMAGGETHEFTGTMTDLRKLTEGQP